MREAAFDAWLTALLDMLSQLLRAEGAPEVVLMDSGSGVTGNWLCM
jgi:hypothetical protein